MKKLFFKIFSLFFLSNIINAQNGILYQAAYNGSFYEFGYESLPKISVTGAPEDTDWDRWSILHDGEVYRLYFMPIGKSNKLYQFGYNPTTERYEYGYKSMPIIPIANLPIDANVTNFSILYDGSYYRLYFKSSDNYSIYQCAFNTTSSRYEFGYQSIKEISITNAPTDIDIKSWTMLHDGENYRLYFKSAKSKNLLHQFGFNGISYEYGYQSIEVLGVEGMPSIPFTRKFNITFDGIAYRYYNLQKPY